ncbi:MAG: hypothetical protein WC058_09170 [Phycisphaeraceae bacterium]
MSDWLTQRWVQLTGRRVDLSSDGWLDGPIAPTRGVSADYFEEVARAKGLRVNQPKGATGILPDFGVLRSRSFMPERVSASVVDFYEKTSGYELDAWAQWSGVFRSFGWLLAVLFSRRLQQLNVPLSGLDTRMGVTNEVLELVDDATGVTRHRAWLRRLRGTGHVLYAGFYSACCMPDEGPCVKVVFPLPNGNAIVFMRTECREDGSFVITSAGRRFGDPGFYFTVHGTGGQVWARYVRAMRETIRVYPAEDGYVRADHALRFFGLTFLRIYYRGL